MSGLSRRQFLRRAFLSTALLGAGGLAYPTLIEPRRLRVRRLTLKIQGLPAVLQGFTIAQLTDLHRSTVVSSDYLSDCVRTANAMAPDIIVFTGDYLTRSNHLGVVGEWLYGEAKPSEELVTECAQCMSLARAPYGVFASLGNHDHWFDGNLVTSIIESAGIPVLRNASHTLRIRGESLSIVGLGDLWTEGVDIQGAFRGLDSPFHVVLMHNPDTFEHWQREGSHLILAGHTHGGQINIPFYGPPVVPSVYGMKYAHGLFTRGASQMYVSSGVGMIAPPVRFNCPPEIALFQLQKA